MRRFRCGLRTTKSCGGSIAAGKIWKEYLLEDLHGCRRSLFCRWPAEEGRRELIRDRGNDRRRHPGAELRDRRAKLSESFGRRGRMRAESREWERDRGQ